MHYLGEERVQTVHLLFFFDECVVLSDALEGELLHEVDLMRFPQEALLEVVDGYGEGGGEEEDLAILGQEVANLLHERLKLRR